MASQPKRRIAQPIGVNTPKNMMAIITGLTTACISAPSFIQARLSGASQCARVSVTAATATAATSSHGWNRPIRVKTTAKVQPKVRFEGSGTADMEAWLMGDEGCATQLTPARCGDGPNGSGS